MSPDRTLTLRRIPFAFACRVLADVELRVLCTLTATACPRTKRIWTTPLRLAEEFNVAPLLIDAALAALVARGHLTLWSRGRGALCCYEVGPVLVRRLDEAPENLPVERPT